MTAPSPVLQPPWPHRWVLTMLGPEAVVVAGGAGAVWLVTGEVFASLCAAAALVTAAYVRRLAEFARMGADQRVPPLTPAAALRHDLPRFAGSVVVRSAGAALLGLVAGIETGTAIVLGLLVGVTVGWVQLTRQVAIIRTFRDP